MEAIAILVLFVVCILIGMSIANAIGFTTLVAFLILGSSISIIPQKMFMGVNQFTFLCIPFFVLAADIMTDGGITRQILDFCNQLVGHVSGGLAHVNILASALFAGITGSATADAVGLGSLEIKMMTEAGYGRDFSAGITAASAIIGPIIPPSNAMIIYATVAGNVSVITLFMAGIVPGILIAITLIALCWLLAKRNHYPKADHRASWGSIGKSLVKTFPALLMPAIILGGILTGTFTATEAAAVSVVYAVVVTKFLYHRFNLKNFYRSLVSTAKTTCVVYFIIAVASSMGWAITVLRIPQALAGFTMQYASNRYLFLLFANLLLLVIGMLLDQAPAILLMAPILTPMAVQFGVDPVHFGIIVVVNLCIGLISPPIGMTLFVTSGVAGISLERMYRSILPFFLVEVGTLAIITYMPDLVLLVPRLFGYGG